MSNVRKPKNPQKVTKIEALRCYFGPDREIKTSELKELTSEEREELAKMVCSDQGWVLV